MTESNENELFPTRTFTVADPRRFDGDPYEVAERSVKQAAAVAGLLDDMLDAADKMARNAEMERAFAAHEEPRGDLWPQTPLGKRFRQIREQVAITHKALTTLAVAAGYNPRKPPKE